MSVQKISLTEHTAGSGIYPG